MQREIVCAQTFDYIIQLWRIYTAKTLQDSVFHLQSFTSLITETFKAVETKAGPLFRQKNPAEGHKMTRQCFRDGEAGDCVDRR